MQDCFYLRQLSEVFYDAFMLEQCLASAADDRLIL